MKTEDEIRKEIRIFVVAGLSLTRPISISDIEWAIEEGFNAGEKFAIGEKKEFAPQGDGEEK